MKFIKKSSKNAVVCEKWYKFIKISQTLLNFEYTFSLGPKPNWTPSVIWVGKLTKFEQIDGACKEGLSKYF